MLAVPEPLNFTSLFLFLGHLGEGERWVLTIQSSEGRSLSESDVNELKAGCSLLRSQCERQMLVGMEKFALIRKLTIWGEGRLMSQIQLWRFCSAVKVFKGKMEKESQLINEITVRFVTISHCMKACWFLVIFLWMLCCSHSLWNYWREGWGKDMVIC